MFCDRAKDGRFRGRVHAINVRRAKPARSRSKGLTAPGMLLQYPTPRFPRTSISRDRLAQILIVNDRDIPETQVARPRRAAVRY